MPWRWIIIVAVCVPLFVFYGWVLFDSWRGALSSLVKSSRNDWEVETRPVDDEERLDETFAGFNVLGFAVLCGVTVYLVHMGARSLGW